MKRSSRDDKHSKTIYCMLIAVFFFCCITFDALAVDDANLGVRLMVWNSLDSELKIKGQGAGRRQTITVKDTESGAVIGITKSRRDGSWRFIKGNLAYAPCSALVESSNGQAVTSDYTRNAPQSCGQPPLQGLRQKLSEIRSIRQHELEIKGRCNSESLSDRSCSGEASFESLLAQQRPLPQQLGIVFRSEAIGVMLREGQHCPLIAAHQGESP